MELCWVPGSIVETSKAEYPYFLQEERPIECTCTRNCPDVVSVLLFCSSQYGFRAGENLYRKGLRKMAGWFLIEFLKSRVLLQLFLTALVNKSPSRRGAKLTINLERLATGQEVVEAAIASMQDYVRDPSCT